MDKRRIPSIDILRGVVIVLMALDHSRDVFSLTPQRPELQAPLQAGWFFTRWITHFCAPVFVFLAGTSAFLYENKIQSKSELSRYLVVRGLWLIAIEVTVVTASWTFSLPTTAGFLILQVIWAIGCAMIVLAGLIWLPMAVVFCFGLLLAVGHNALDAVRPEQFGSWDWSWQLLHQGNSWIQVSQDPPFGLVVMYPLIPWVGVLALGYSFGPVMKWDAAQRGRCLLCLGAVVSLAFIGFRITNGYGDPTPFSAGKSLPDSIMRFLNTEKYPPSFLFLAMTLGPMFIVLAALEDVRGRIWNALTVFGKVPLFFYLLHMPILTALGMLWFTVRHRQALVLLTTPPNELPSQYHPSLAIAFSMWFVVLLLMYMLCRWYGRYKATHAVWWLKLL